MTHPWFLGARTPRVLAHRGFVPPDADGMVENTLAAIAAAHAVGAEYVESDCHLTRDGAVVLFHDADLTRVTGDPRAVADVRYAELAAIMADRGGLVTAAEALEAFPTLRFNLDVKAEDAALPLGRVIAAHADRVLVTSFSDRRRRRALEAARAAGGDPATSAGQATIARLLAAVATGSRGLVRRTLANVQAIQVPERAGAVRIVTPRLVRAVHAADVEIHVWTVNDSELMIALLNAGVDGLVTDRADVALETIRQRRV
ncbi:MAG: glycerophosphodiester phosphodiesterase [Microbacterium sp.]|uniref:glycerophosphodiester phosphodiesterase family protein n=1 Tax=Microbacterium sp. TaxID=51671 RepID=UPI001AC9CB5A|nr:glycerophosphodiester phosphodiesterase family protein [Microbacterium sp.]MBN9177299.1 glycerophosphodiester phosphodiesterase [Microbacterium sp.]